MTELSLRSVRPVETKEVASLSARFLTGLVIAMAGILSLVALVEYLGR
jgi:hypothetical protein